MKNALNRNRRILATLAAGITALIISFVAERFGVNISEEVADQINLEVTEKIEAVLVLASGLFAGWFVKDKPTEEEAGE